MTQPQRTAEAAERAKPIGCPFCGAMNVSVSEGSTFRWRYAGCNECGAQSGEIRVQTLGDGDSEVWEEQATRDALAAWNARASSSQPAAAVAVPAGFSKEDRSTIASVLKLASLKTREAAAWKDEASRAQLKAEAASLWQLAERVAAAPAAPSPAVPDAQAVDAPDAGGT